MRFTVSHISFFFLGSRCCSLFRYLMKFYFTCFQWKSKGAAVCLKNKRNNILCASYNEQFLEKNKSQTSKFIKIQRCSQSLIGA